MFNPLEIGIKSHYKTIKAIQFGVQSPNEIKNDSKCEINNSNLKVERKNNNDDNSCQITRGNVYDSYMGVIGNDDKCDSCGFGPVECPGHFGHIKLAVKILHPKFMKVVMDILKCICDGCSRSLLSQGECEILSILNYKGNIRLDKYKKNAEKVKECQYCLTKISSYSMTDLGIRKTTGDIKKIMIDSEIYDIFVKIRSDEFMLFGFNNSLLENDKFKKSDNIFDRIKHRHEILPDWFFFDILPVMPPIVRPYSIRDGKKNDDDLTDKYISVIKLNNKILNYDEILIKESLKKTVKKKKNKEDLIREMKDHIMTLFDNKSGKSKIAGSKSHTGLRERIDGKEGIMRSNLQGKRSNNTARTVIAPASSTYINEVCVPQEIASTTTLPMIVNKINIDELQRMVFMNKINRIVRRGRTILLYDPKLKKNYDINEKFYEMIIYNNHKYIKLKLNDIVERQLKDNDRVIINRQPTLRLESMLGLKAKITDEKVLRINLTNCNSFHADFDGNCHADNENLHCHQQVAA